MPPGNNVTREAVDVPQHRVHLKGGDQATQVSSASRRGFDTLLTNDYNDLNHAPTVTAHDDSKFEATLSNSPVRTTSSIGTKPGPDPFQGYQSEPLDKNVVDKIKSLIPSIYRCKRCGYYYHQSHNEVGDCQKGHSGRCIQSRAAFKDYSLTTAVGTGMYRNGFPRGVTQPYAFRHGPPPERYLHWTCCGQRRKDAPACNSGRAVKHTSKGKVSFTKYEKSPAFRRFMRQFL